MNVGPRHRLLGLGATLTVLALVAACSSTERDGKAAAPSAEGAAVATPAPGGRAPGGPAAPGRGAASPGARGAAAGSGTTAVTSPGAGGTSGTTPAEAARFRSMKMGKGLTATTIKLGIQFANTAAYEAAATSLGGSTGKSGTVSDPKGAQNALIDYFNAMGGIAGRKIVPVWAENTADRAVTKEGRTRDAQAACATYTEDNKVFAIMGSGQWTEDNIIECAVRTDTPYVDGWHSSTGVWVSESRANKIARDYYSTSMFTTDRRERAMVEGLKKMGFFGTGAKVGLVVEDASAFRDATQRSLKPALKAMGVNVVSEVAYPDIIEAPWQNYVLQFLQAGVTHVFFTASSGEAWPTLLFMRAAENQQYRPKYAISGLPVPWLMNNAPKQQLANAAGVTWMADRIEQSPKPVSARQVACKKVLAKKGFPESLAPPYCDFFWFVKDSLERADELTPAGMMRGAESLGGSWTSSMTYGGKTRFGPGRHDGAYRVRSFSWDKAKARMVYRSDFWDVP